jgi:hypothetical protein
VSDGLKKLAQTKNSLSQFPTGGLLLVVLKEWELDLVVVSWLSPMDFRVALSAYREQIAR